MAKKKEVKQAAIAPHVESVSVDEFLGDSAVSPKETRERPKGEVIVSGASFHNFEENPIVVGNYVRDVVREKDGPNAATNPNEKAGSIMGYLFVTEDGTETIIGNSFSIAKALENPKYKNETLWIEFQGKTTVKGKPFNRFHIQTVA